MCTPPEGYVPSELGMPPRFRCHRQRRASARAARMLLHALEALLHRAQPLVSHALHAPRLSLHVPRLLSRARAFCHALPAWRHVSATRQGMTRGRACAQTPKRCHGAFSKDRKTSFRSRTTPRPPPSSRPRPRCPVPPTSTRRLTQCSTRLCVCRVAFRQSRRHVDSRFCAASLPLPPFLCRPCFAALALPGCCLRAALFGCQQGKSGGRLGP